LAWNKKAEDASVLSTRTYLSPGFSHVLGYVSYPTKDSSGVYWQNEFKGISGLEKEYNSEIKGENGSKIIETDAKGIVHSENIINAPERGTDLLTTIDSRIQEQIYGFIKNLSERNNFTGGAGIVMDVRNGEIIAATSFPEYDSEILSLGNDREKINNYLNDKRKFFLDRNVSGLYTPGSIVKPFFALGALAEGIIDPDKKILSTGSISIPNPYFKDQETVFKDWKAHGWTDMAQALAVSSDVYFYTIGGGYESQKGLGIVKIGEYAKLFGIGEATGVDLPSEVEGVVPSPEWKIKNFAGDPWRIGNTYHTAIGQYGFQVTPIEMARAVGAIANNGKLVTPHFLLGDTEKENQISEINSENKIRKEYFDIVKDGMRQAVSYGTAVTLNVPYVKVAAKTGTAELGVSKNKINSWVIGFFPYENPKYAFAVMMEAGPASGGAGASSIMRQLLDWMSKNTPEYFEVF
jgi:penicillin-binding protein 2